MSAALTTPALATRAPATPAPAPADAEAAFQRQTLHDLTVWTADVAYTLRNAVETADNTDDLLQLAAAFDVAARTVRRTVMLARHAAKPPRPEPDRSAPQRTATPRPQSHLRLADRDTPDRPDTPDPAPDGRPVAEQIEDLRRDLERLQAACPVPAAGIPHPARDPASASEFPPSPPPHRARPADPPPVPDG